MNDYKKHPPKYNTCTVHIDHNQPDVVNTIHKGRTVNLRVCDTRDNTVHALNVHKQQQTEAGMVTYGMGC